MTEVTEIPSFLVFPTVQNPMGILLSITLTAPLIAVRYVGDVAHGMTTSWLDFLVGFFKNADKARLDRVMLKEADLQRRIARATPLGLTNKSHAAQCLVENAAAMRVFLTHAKDLRWWDNNMVVSLAELLAAKLFVANFSGLEQALLDRRGVRLDDAWKQDDGGRDALSVLLCEDYALFQQASNWYISSTWAKENLVQNCLAALQWGGLAAA